MSRRKQSTKMFRLYLRAVRDYVLRCTLPSRSQCPAKFEHVLGMLCSSESSPLSKWRPNRTLVPISVKMECNRKSLQVPILHFHGLKNDEL